MGSDSGPSGFSGPWVSPASTATGKSGPPVTFRFPDSKLLTLAKETSGENGIANQVRCSASQKGTVEIPAGKASPSHVPIFETKKIRWGGVVLFLGTPFLSNSVAREWSHSSPLV